METLDDFVAARASLAVDVRQALVDGVNAVARAIQVEANDALTRLLGPSHRMSGLRGSSKKVYVTYTAARVDRPVIVAAVRGTGPVHLLERPRKGGYKVTAKGKALHVGYGDAGPFKSVHPGPELNPPRPLTQVFARGQQIADRVTPGVVVSALEQNWAARGRKTRTGKPRGRAR